MEEGNGVLSAGMRMKVLVSAGMARLSLIHCAPVGNDGFFHWRMMGLMASSTR